MSLIIAGDIVPCKNDVSLFEKCDTKRLLNDELFNKWYKAEHRLFNLEAPIIDNGIPIVKCGPNLHINENCVKCLKDFKPSLICLANNHILDYDEEGLTNTIKLLGKYEIDYVGVGKNINNIKKYNFLSIDGKKVAIYNVCETEFSNASIDRAGAYAYDEGEVIKDIIFLKKNSDYIVIIYHGGKEHYRYPSPLLQKRCRLMADFGADLIVCQHSHCIGCMESYNNCSIIYGQGNFIFNMNDNEFWNSSLLLDISFKSKIEINYIPIIRLEEGVGIPDKEEQKKILNNFIKRSNEIKIAGTVESKYNSFSKEMINNYLINIYSDSFFFRVLLKITRNKILKCIYKKNNLVKLQNYIACESHRELFINGIKEIIK